MAARIVINLSTKERRKLAKIVKHSLSHDLRQRCLIVQLYDQGFGAEAIARTVGCASSTASRVGRRFERLGHAGLIDGRSDPKATRVTDDCAALLCDLIEATPRDYGWLRATWTQELLMRTLEAITGLSFSRSSIVRLLRKVGARKGRPRATVSCPWSKRKREARLRTLGRLVKNCPLDEVVVYEDEVDIHLNPKIGLDWMLPGTQKPVLTPGQNKKHYVAGALDAHTGEVAFVDGQRKKSELFIELLNHLASTVYPGITRIHVIVDNYGIHSSQRTREAVEAHDGRIMLHFLPPYCPSANDIEKLWKDLHDNITRNHRCKTIKELMTEVYKYLAEASPFPGSQPSLARAS